eukprot:CAMPEP_0198140270 /NCGR_PEP_ID=MMETSP1443-20131203/3459_1 /TAXON_ID=186043 /ORGANISM="Entomoneis sp., Strain CCMP2396" /LENGTH=238 /DNA_ID=CAMNT_0043802643 /DNA_START=136 /DNA_END=849 /DNA_ORIENTATION=+
MVSLIDTILPPIVIGLVTTVVARLITRMVEVSNRNRVKRESQILGATKICDAVMLCVDTHFSRTKYLAVETAFRQGSSFSFFAEQDEKTMNEYRQSLANMRQQHITFETKLKAFFGERGYEGRLYHAILNQFDVVDGLLRQRYYSGHTSSSSNGDTPLDAKVEDEAARQRILQLLEDTHGKIKTLSSTMTFCIQKMHVGTLVSGKCADEGIQNIPPAWVKEAGLPVRPEAEMKEEAIS